MTILVFEILSLANYFKIGFEVKSPFEAVRRFGGCEGICESRGMLNLNQLKA